MTISVDRLTFAEYLKYVDGKRHKLGLRERRYFGDDDCFVYQLKRANWENVVDAKVL